MVGALLNHQGHSIGIASVRATSRASESLEIVIDKAPSQVLTNLPTKAPSVNVVFTYSENAIFEGLPGIDIGMYRIGYDSTQNSITA